MRSPLPSASAPASRSRYRATSSNARPDPRGRVRALRNFAPKPTEQIGGAVARNVQEATGVWIVKRFSASVSQKKRIGCRCAIPPGDRAAHLGRHRVGDRREIDRASPDLGAMRQRDFVRNFAYGPDVGLVLDLGQRQFGDQPSSRFGRRVKARAVRCECHNRVGVVLDQPARAFSKGKCRAGGVYGADENAGRRPDRNRRAGAGKRTSERQTQSTQPCELCTGSRRERSPDATDLCGEVGKRDLLPAAAAQVEKPSRAAPPGFANRRREPSMSNSQTGPALAACGAMAGSRRISLVGSGWCIDGRPDRLSSLRREVF